MQYLLTALAIPAIYFGFNAISRWLSAQANRWDNDGVVRGPGYKLWREHSPRNFATFVGMYRFSAEVWWLFARVISGILVIVLVASILASAFHAALTRT